MTEQPVPHPTFEDRHGQTWYQWKDTAVLPHVADMYADLKKLTAAELAAEYWHFDMADFDYPADPDEITAESWTELMNRMRQARAALHRFATLPHASENGYQ